MDTPAYSLHYIRPLGDLYDIKQIEDCCFETPWSLEEFERQLRGQNVTGVVARADNRAVVGYCLYEKHTFKIDILNFAVHPEHRHRKIGRSFIEWVLTQLRRDGIPRLTCLVKETNLDVQRFLRACGIKAVNVVKRPFPDTKEDGYLFAQRVFPELRIAA